MCAKTAPRRALFDAHAELAGNGHFESGTDSWWNPVHQLRRLKYDLDDNVIAVELSATPFSLAPRLKEENLDHLTTYDYFARIGVPAAKSRVYVDPIALDAVTAARLSVPEGQAVIRLRRLTWLRSHCPDPARRHAYPSPRRTSGRRPCAEYTPAVMSASRCVRNTGRVPVSGLMRARSSGSRDEPGSCPPDL
ncbi:UTRA domain-containing protein [Streptomyces sp. NBRC 110028]|uniref:UTRA domain-containing protein n=1 Tax=Streptomyces sp. NBRC 110028 TaxID=1621260 RepID=UPI000B26613E|nr:UTRA domain-containing protein [Streptomyces sp. NBRC 110028]